MKLIAIGLDFFRASRGGHERAPDPRGGWRTPRPWLQPWAPLGAQIAAGVLALFPGGCTVGPDYQAPKPEVSKAYANAAPATQPGAARSSTTSSAAEPVAQWWTTLGDPELDGLIKRAIGGNIGLQEAASRLLQARAQLRLAGAANLPNVKATGSFVQIDTGSNNSFPPGSSAGAINGSIWQAGLGATWEIDVFGGERRRIEAARGDMQAAVEDQRAAQVALVAQVAYDYVQLRGVQERLNIARQNIALQQDTLGLTRSLRKAGFSSELDVSNQQSQLSLTQAQIAPLTTEISRQQHALATLLGLEPNALVGELTQVADWKPLPKVVAIGLPVDLLRRRPDIRRAERQIAAANARVGAAVADYYPRFSLTGDFGLDSSKFQDLFNWESRYLIVYPSVDWRIFDFGRTAAMVDQEKERQRQAALAYQDTLLTALREVEDALVAYGNEQDRRANLVGADRAARESVEIARDQYKQGVTDFLEVLEAQRQLLQVQDELAQSDAAMNVNLVGLYRSLGGGWEAANSNGKITP